MQYASRSSRLLGQFIDGLVIFVPLAGIYVASGFGEVAAVVYALAWACWALFHVFLADGLPGGQSLGKRVFQTRVVDAQSGLPCTFGQSLIRNLLLSLLGPIDWVFIFGDKHQRLGDKAAGTIVVPAV